MTCRFSVMLMFNGIHYPACCFSWMGNGHGPCLERDGGEAMAASQAALGSRGILLMLLPQIGHCPCSDSLRC